MKESVERDTASDAPAHGDRDGVTFDPKRDRARLNCQMDAVWAVMRDRQWHTLAEISEKAGAPQASVSARLRDLRKPEFGGRIVERQYVERGLWRYRIADAMLGEGV